MRHYTRRYEVVDKIKYQLFRSALPALVTNVPGDVHFRTNVLMGLVKAAHEELLREGVIREVEP